MAEGDIHTVPHGDGWANRTAGKQRVTSTFDTKAEAQSAGKDSAITRGVEHLVHGKDGEIQSRNTYPRSRDPRSSKG